MNFEESQTPVKLQTDAGFDEGTQYTYFIADGDLKTSVIGRFDRARDVLQPTAPCDTWMSRKTLRTAIITVITAVLR